MKWLRFVMAAAVIIMLSGSSWADTIKLKDGQVIHGTIIEEGEESVTIKHYLSSATFRSPQSPQYKIVTIEKSEIAEIEINKVKEKEQKGMVPPSNAIRITGEIFAGLAGGIGGALVGGYLLGYSIGDVYERGTETGIFLGSIGYILGTTIGVYKVGTKGNETGSFLATLSGSTLGGALGGFLLFLSVSTWFEWNGGNDTSEAILFFSSLVCSPIGATIGFNNTRRYDPLPPSEKALINFSDGQTSLAVPTIHLRPKAHVDLVKVRF